MEKVVGKSQHVGSRIPSPTGPGRIERIWRKVNIHQAPWAPSMGTSNGKKYREGQHSIGVLNRATSLAAIERAEKGVNAPADRGPGKKPEEKTGAPGGMKELL